LIIANSHTAFHLPIATKQEPIELVILIKREQMVVVLHRPNTQTVRILDLRRKENLIFRKFDFLNGPFGNLHFFLVIRVLELELKNGVVGGEEQHDAVDAQLDFEEMARNGSFRGESEIVDDQQLSFRLDQVTRMLEVVRQRYDLLSL
jgi:hypothetical protein